MIKKNYTCLLVETSDGRKFFTEEKNYKLLLEFADTCNAQMAIVEVEEATVFNLKKLAEAISNFTPQKTVPNYKLIEQKIEKKKKKMNNFNGEISNYITSKFSSGDIVGLREVCHYFEYTGVSKSCICNHISKIKKDFIAKGREVKKIGAGRYQLGN